MLSFEQVHLEDDAGLANVFRGLDSVEQIHEVLISQLEVLGGAEGGEIEQGSILDRLLYHAVREGGDASLRAMSDMLRQRPIRSEIISRAKQEREP